MADTREFEEVEYGVVATLPDGTWKSDKQYDIGKIVEYDGSSYAANKKPPIGTLPTDKNYWQISAQGASKATSEALGVVKPDNTTTEVDENAVMSVKTATQTTKGIVKGSSGIKVGQDGSIDVDTQFTQAAQLANIIAGEAISEVLGKVSKSIASVMGLEQNALLKNMLTSINVNDPNKIPTAALTYAMQQAITKNANDITQLNSDLGAVKMKSLLILGNSSAEISYKRAALVMLSRNDTKICRLYNSWGGYIDLITPSGITATISGTEYETVKSITISQQTSTAVSGLVIYY